MMQQSQFVLMGFSHHLMHGIVMFRKDSFLPNFLSYNFTSGVRGHRPKKKWGKTAWKRLKIKKKRLKFWHNKILQKRGNQLKRGTLTPLIHTPVLWHQHCQKHSNINILISAWQRHFQARMPGQEWYAGSYGYAPSWKSVYVWWEVENKVRMHKRVSSRS